MSIISISITESEEQVVSDIPKFISISTNIPATIFFTLDGTTPTLFSEIYTSPIFLPTNSLKIELKVFATNGVITSPLLTEVYQTNILDNTRLPHSATTSQPSDNTSLEYPFGTNTIQPIPTFLSPGEASITVDNPSLQQIPNAYDGSGNETAFTNKEYTVENYSIVYNNRDYNGLPIVGNLPADVTIEIPDPPPEESNQFDKLFDPRALVIFQDYSKEDPSNPSIINRQFFSFEDPEKVRDGCLFYSTGLDSPSPTGSFLRSHFNPKDNTITYYYFDSRANKWIISKTPYVQTGSFDGNLSGLVLSKNKGAGFVFEWIPFARRAIF